MNNLGDFSWLEEIVLCDPEPDLLEDVSGNQLRPVAVLGIEGCLSGGDVCVDGLDPGRTLEDLPEEVEAEEDGDTEVGGEEI